jgi:hypothetical protein
MSKKPPHEIMADRLAAYLGPNTARVALRTFSERIGGRPPEELTREDVGPLLEALRPMLRTLLGRQRAEDLLLQLTEDLK